MFRVERYAIKIAACSRVENLDHQGVGGGLRDIIRNSMRERIRGRS